MIDKLTPRQEEAIVPFREKWKARILTTEKTDEEIKQGIRDLYEMVGLKQPKHIWIMDSMLGVQLAFNFIKNTDWEKLDISNIRNNIRNNIWNNIRNNIENNIRNNIRDLIKNSKLEFVGFSSNESSWLQWHIYQLFYFEDDLLKEDDSSIKLRKYIDCVIDAWSVYYSPEIAIVSRKPIVSLNNEGFLNNHHGASVSFKDGYSLYYLNGVNFPFELWQKVVSREMPMEEVLKIVDIDQRTQAMKFAKDGLRDFYKSQGGKCIDSYDKFDMESHPIHYELWEIPQGQIFNKTVHFAVYDCPSAKSRGEKKEYAKGVPAFKTVAEAMSWGMSDDTHTITPGQWKLLIPNVHES